MKAIIECPTCKGTGEGRKSSLYTLMVSKMWSMLEDEHECKTCKGKGEIEVTIKEK